MKIDFMAFSENSNSIENKIENKITYNKITTILYVRFSHVRSTK